MTVIYFIVLIFLFGIHLWYTCSKNKYTWDIVINIYICFVHLFNIVMILFYTIHPIMLDLQPVATILVARRSLMQHCNCFETKMKKMWSAISKGQIQTFLEPLRAPAITIIFFITSGCMQTYSCGTFLRPIVEIYGKTSLTDHIHRSTDINRFI